MQGAPFREGGIGVFFFTRNGLHLLHEGRKWVTSISNAASATGDLTPKIALSPERFPGKVTPKIALSPESTNDSKSCTQRRGLPRPEQRRGEGRHVWGERGCKE